MLDTGAEVVAAHSLILQSTWPLVLSFSGISTVCCVLSGSDGFPDSSLEHGVSIPVLWSVWYHDYHVLQVPRILNPVVLVVDALPDLCKDTQVRAYVDSAFGSEEQCRQAQLLYHLLCVCVCVTAQAVSLLMHSQRTGGSDTTNASRQHCSLPLLYPISLSQLHCLGGTPSSCCRRKSILADFFKHAFDGGGADNFFDAGSCIDGRLTSAWNWSSKIEKKPYYNIFKMAGFVGFDGRF